MVKMVSLSRKGGEKNYCDEYDSKYPWGTRLCLDEDVVEKLNAAGLKVGDTVEISAVAVVHSTNSRLEGDEGEVGTRLELQITDLGAGKMKSNADIAAKLFPNQNSGE